MTRRKIKKLITEPMLDTARGIIARCEADLKRSLAVGEKRDLLKDNTKWRSDTVRLIVAKLTNPREAA